MNTKRRQGGAWLALWLALMLLATGSAQANNLEIENAALTNQNVAEGYVYVQFDIRWDNSWRTSDEPFNILRSTPRCGFARARPNRSRDLCRK